MPIINSRSRSSIQPIMTGGREPESSSIKCPVKSCMKVATLHESLKSCETNKRSSIFGSTFHSPSHSRRYSFLSSSTTSSNQRRHHSIFATRKASTDGTTEAADVHHQPADHKSHVDGEQAPSSPGHLRQTLLKVLSIARVESSDGAGHRRVSIIGNSIGRSKKAAAVERPFKGLVKFSDVTIREFDLTASDNPAVRGGAAIEVRGVIALWQLGGGTARKNYMMREFFYLWPGSGDKSPSYSLENPSCLLLTSYTCLFFMH